jgi:predicted amidohydrolase YtcJ
METLLVYNARLMSFEPGAPAAGSSALGGSPAAGGAGADAVFVRDGKIQALGTAAELELLTGADTRRIDAGGKVLMPGFHDTHIHVWKVGNLQTYMLDVRASASLEEMLDRLSDYHHRYPDIAWVTARGFNEAAWSSGCMPTKEDLDRVIPDKPVYLIRTCAHIAVCNSLALSLSGIGPGTKAPLGGMIYRGTDGRPNGVLAETALGLVTAHIPAYTKAELKHMVRTARQSFYQKGITAVTDPAVDPLLLEAYREMEADHESGIRLQAIPILLPDGGAEPYALPELYRSDYLNVDTVKFFSDGGLSGKTAALKRPYLHSEGQRGVLRLDRDQYLGLSRAAVEAGWGIATHAIGDEAIEMVIDVYRSLPAGAHLRIEHLNLPSSTDLEAMARLGIGTSMQSIFLSELGINYLRSLDQAYLHRCLPIRSVLEQGILMALSSDAPVVRDFNPFKGMEAALTRRDNEGDLIGLSEAIDLTQALRAYTYSAAALSRMPDYGRLAPGCVADFILLDKNPFDLSPERLTEVRVDQTFIGGTCVWSV